MSPEATDAPYGGPGWRPRLTPLRKELGTLWSRCGVDSEWAPLKAVLLHRPGREIERAVEDPKGALMLKPPDPGAMQLEHDLLASTYRAQGVEVHYVDPPTLPSPNLLFSADLLAMTPEGAIVGRPASEVRAGEERWVARALAELGIPILRTVGGRGTFEGADLMWLAPERVLVAQGLRTNSEGAAQVSATLEELGAEVQQTHLPPGTMHLMGQLRIPDRGLAVAWEGRLPEDAVELLARLGFRVHFIPDEEEARAGYALNFVTLSPGKILMPRGNPVTQSFYEGLGIECLTVEAGELGKAAGSIGCLTGVLEREPLSGT